MLQRQKLEKLKELVNPVGRTEAIKIEIKQLADDLVEPLASLESDLRHSFSLLRHQSNLLNKLCLKNDYPDQHRKDQVNLIVNCQTWMVGSLASLSHGEVKHIESVAQWFKQKNILTPVCEKIVLRSSPFFGGKEGQNE